MKSRLPEGVIWGMVFSVPLWVAIIYLCGLICGCSSIQKPKLLETDNPPGYECATHGAIARVYKVGAKYYCKTCVDENIGQVEMIITK